MSARFAVADYTAALAALRPRGRAWPDDPSSVQVQTLGGCAPSFNRLDANVQALLVDAFPATSVNLLGEWEQTLGLSAGALSITQRQANVVAALTAVGGQSAAYFIAFAAALGATITIQTYAPMRCSLNGCGDAVGGEDWCFAWSINVTANTGMLTSAQILAMVQAIAPAETTVFLAS